MREVHTPRPDVENLPDFHFPNILTESDLKDLSYKGLRIARYIKKNFSDQQRNNWLVGNEAFTLGYLVEMFGGVEGFKGKRIIVVADGDITPDRYRTFTATQSRIIAGLGAEKVVLVDPIALSTNYEEFDNMDILPSEIQAIPTPSKKFDVVVSSQFLGGPDWQSKVVRDPMYSINLIKSMARLSDIQVHLGAAEEVDLSMLSSEKLLESGVNAIYNFDVNRNQGNRFNKFSDFLVVDNRDKI